MICPKCEKHSLNLDDLTGMYYCNKCQSLLTQDDLLRHSKNKKEYHDDGYEFDDEVEIETDESEEWEEEDMNAFSLTVLSIIQTIPIIGLIPPIMLANSNVKEEYKRVFGYRLVGQVIGILAMLFLYLLWYNNYKIELREVVIPAFNEVVTFIMLENKDIRDISALQIPTGKTYEDLLPTHSVIDEIEDVGFTQDNWQHFNGVVMTGTQVRKLISDTIDYEISYLLQTVKIADRHGNKTYRLMGRLLNGYTLDDSTPNRYIYYIEQMSSYSLYTNDFGEYVSVDIDGIDNSSYIFYIKPNAHYEFDLIEDSEETIIGFLFKEVE